MQVAERQGLIGAAKTLPSDSTVKKMRRKKAATSGGLGALITMLMAATAFKKNELPKLKSASIDGPPTKTQIRD